jgi:hypothetical protein
VDIATFIIAPIPAKYRHIKPEMILEFDRIEKQSS